MPEITEEQLRQMTPEQIRQLQKQNCLFCRIVEGKIPSRKVYEDSDFLVILDINPANPGHLLILPKEHYQIMPQIPDDIIGKMFMLAKAFTTVTLKSLKSQGTTIFAANGVVAGQRAPHFMLHVIPRTDKDGVGMAIPERQVSEAELEALKKPLSERLRLALGVKEEPVTMDKKPEKIDADFRETKQPGPKQKLKKKAEKKNELGQGSKVNLDDLAKAFSISEKND